VADAAPRAGEAEATLIEDNMRATAKATVIASRFAVRAGECFIFFTSSLDFFPW
jgi:hypothetical protein